MKVKVMKEITLQYGGKAYINGDVFNIKEEHLAGLEDFVEPLDTETHDQTEEIKEETADEDKGIEELTVTEIKELLDATGIEYPKTAKKVELISLLKK